MEKNNLTQKLFELRKAVKGFVPDTNNDYFSSKYFNINAMINKLNPVLEELKLLIMQPIEATENGDVMSLIVIDADSGDKQKLASMNLPKLTDPQKMGSAITYYRRYMLQSALFWGAVDDDGNDAADGYTSQIKTEIDKINDLDELRQYTLSKALSGELMSYAQERSKRLKNS